MWTFAIKETELSDNRIHRIYPRGVAALIFKKDGGLFSLSSNCPHMGCSLGGAVVEGETIQCPCHDWKFDLATGRFTEAKEIGLQTYPLKSENGDVSIDL
ncbi:MAG TPA: Rieske (2Fe-2S) protein [Chitinivibrionales bacterium]|nr:Rieske (2Fe-2S) protein [Chitinivibrionales bacterium]